ncbi:MAG TPA: phospholipase D-like domain-containing protein [bacterium]|nr:phospholipase D-like domain-containing protein [bacterium]HPN42446.1 phospholipase D-like domain-containing protein [bacterium]
MEVANENNGVKVRAYKGDAMTLLAFDVKKELRTNLAGFTIRFRYKNEENGKLRSIYNRLTFSAAFLKNNPDIPDKNYKNSTLYSPIQKFNWVHVPSTDIDTQTAVFGDYEYKVTPRYIQNGRLLRLDENLTVSVTINVGPFDMKNTKIGFTRGFVSSVAYAERFNVNNNRVRPPAGQDSLLFDITQKADTAKRHNYATNSDYEVDYTFEEQHKWLGWQARQRIIEFLDQVINDNSLSLKAFTYDLNEPEICKRLLVLAGQNRLKMILDNSGKHGDNDSMESTFADKFTQFAANSNDLQRGKFFSMAHCKVFIQIKANKGVKVLTGSTNFSTNGLYINSNHVLIINNENVAQLYNEVFDESFGVAKMKTFKGSKYSTNDFIFKEAAIPEMTITFAPHPKDAADRIFNRIKNRILEPDNTDILFAIMKDTSKSSILDAVKQQVKNDQVFTYGITDSISKKDDYSVFLYKPNSLKGLRVAAKGIENTLPEPFGKVAGIDGYAIHHKFIVVNFKGKDPVVYCGSSNLAFSPEQKNGDNLLEIHDDDIVTVFAIEALRLVDHFHWRNKEIKEKSAAEKTNKETLILDDLSHESKAWYQAWFNVNDLKNRQRELYIQK